MEIIRTSGKISDIVDTLLSYNIAEFIIGSDDVTTHNIQRTIERAISIREASINFTTIRINITRGYLFRLTPSPLTNLQATVFLLSD